MKYFTVIAAIVFSACAYGQFYDLNTIQEIKITFAQSNWDAILDAQKAGSEDYTMATTVEINGTVFDSVGVKYKGNSTYRATQTKNPFHIELDTYKDQDYEGYKDIKLSNVANDPSFVREVLSYQILRQYMVAPECNYANVYVNGTLIGLYSNAEAISKTFLKNRFDSKNNTFVKCNPPAGAGPGTTSYPNLTYLGTDSTKYYASYEMKSDGGWDELIHLTDTLNNSVGSLTDILDVNRALWMLAFNNVLVNLDSYSGGFAQNYYLYRSDYNQFLPIVWDLNESFGRFTQTGSSSVSLRSTTDKQQMTHLLHENEANYPLISKLLADPTYKRMYIAHCKTMLEENFANGSYLVTGAALQSTIDAAVQADNNKFFTYANFTANLRTDVSGGGGGPGGRSTNGIGNLMDGRATYLLAQSDFTATSPTISTPASSNAAPSINSSFTITTTVSNQTSVLIGYRFTSNSPFMVEAMFDDGAHGDGAAGDGVFGSQITMQSLKMEYYVYAENANAGLFSPRRAEHEFYTLSPAGLLVINEVMSSNKTTIASDVGSFSDWIELYNGGSSSIALGDYYLSDDEDEPTKWQLPVASLASKGYQMIWASGDVTQGEWHSNFKLSKDGETLGLYYSTGGDTLEVDVIDIPALSNDQSYGRESDGAATWVKFDVGTPNDTNRVVVSDTTSIEQHLLEGIQFFPNPANDVLNYNLGSMDQAITVEFIDAVGRTSKSVSLDANEGAIDISELNTGVYFISFQSEAGFTRIEKLIKD